AVGAQRLHHAQCLQRYVALQGGEFEGEGAHGGGEAGQRLSLEAFHIDLDEVRRAVGRGQCIQRGDGEQDAAVPLLFLPPHGAGGGSHEGLGGGGDGGVGAVQVQPCLARLAADQGGDAGDAR